MPINRHSNETCDHREISHTTTSAIGNLLRTINGSSLNNDFVTLRTGRKECHGYVFSACLQGNNLPVWADVGDTMVKPPTDLNRMKESPDYA